MQHQNQAQAASMNLHNASSHPSNVKRLQEGQQAMGVNSNQAKQLKQPNNKFAGSNS